MSPDDRALVDRFLDMMAAEAGASRHTLAAYRNDLERASEALGGALGEVSSERVSLLGAQWTQLTPSTGAGRPAPLRRFFGFLAAEGLRPAAPAPAQPRPRFNRPLPRILDETEVHRMFEAADDRA